MQAALWAYKVLFSLTKVFLRTPIRSDGKYMYRATYSRDGHPSTVKRKRHSMNLQINCKCCFFSFSTVPGEV